MAAPTTTTQRRERFERLVADAETLFQRSPSAYKRKLLLLALLGYATIFGILFLVVALIAGSIAGAFASTAFLILLIKKKLIILLAAIAYVMVTAIWVKFDRPDGYTLSRESAPALFDDLEAMRNELDVPPIHQVLLSREFNAAVVQTPRLGIFGWQHNTIILGLPLLLAMSREEARAVLAHELGHLSGNHSRFAGWIYRVRISWYRIMEAFDEAEGFGARMLQNFFDWYAPYFNAMSFALARSNEYEADAISVELTSSTAAANALIRANTLGDYAGDHYWSRLIERADNEPEPERHPYRQLAQFHATLRPENGPLRQSLAASLDIQTDHADTHPSLRDRLKAIGAEAVIPPPPETNAAQIWLADGIDAALTYFDQEWLANNEQPWKDRYEHVARSRDELSRLKARDTNDLEPLELWQLACLTEEYESARNALPLFLDYKQRQPNDPDADFVIGRTLLEDNDPAGVAFMQRAQASFAHAVAASEYLYGFWLRQKNDAKANHWRALGEQAIDRRQLAYDERNSLSAADTFEASGLDSEAMLRLRVQLADREKLASVWIARKQLEVLAQEDPLYVMAFKPKGLFNSAKKLDALRDSIVEELEFPGATFVVALAGDGKAIAKRVKAAGDVLI